MKAKLTFHGGAGGVTGSNFLLELEKTKILIDCGFFQGGAICDEKNYKPFLYDPSSIDILFVTHAHLDHIGRIPKLVREGFKGKIISTPPTKDIAELMLTDSLRVLEKESKRSNRPLIYTKNDVRKALGLWKTTLYHKQVTVEETIKVLLRDAGHILGSSMVEFSGPDGKKIIFTGDLGNSPTPLLRDTVSDAYYIVMESIYGDKNHEEREERKEKLEDIIEETIRAKGVLMIPAFSVERTQEILFEIETMMENNKIPLVPVFLDSPLAIHVTDIYKKYDEYYNKEVKYIINSGEEVFAFSQLRFTLKTEESKTISRFPNPKIIIAGSGMSNGGRILHHEKRYLSDPRSTLLLVSYQAPGSLGREIQDGAKLVNILGDKIAVNARIETLRGYSAHKDADRLFEFVARTADTVKKVFVVMGEPKASTFFTQRLRDHLGINAFAPLEGESVELEF